MSSSVAAEPSASTSDRQDGGFVKALTLTDATMLVAGSMIGSGIFLVSADIGRTVGSPSGLRPDPRQTVRETMRTHGEPSALFWRRRRMRLRPLILFLDVSGSLSA